MILSGEILDVKAYVDWVATNPDISGYHSYFEAFKDQFENDGNQRRIDEYGN